MGRSSIFALLRVAAVLSLCLAKNIILAKVVTNPSQGTVINCVEGQVCEVICSGDGACQGIIVNCADSTTCKLACSGFTTDKNADGPCVNAQMKCQRSKDCKVECTTRGNTARRALALAPEREVDFVRHDLDHDRLLRRRRLPEIDGLCRGIKVNAGQGPGDGVLQSVDVLCTSEVGGTGKGGHEWYICSYGTFTCSAANAQCRYAFVKGADGRNKGVWDANLVGCTASKCSCSNFGNGLNSISGCSSTLFPTPAPTKTPTTAPPTDSPTKSPTKRPTKRPTTRRPTNIPTEIPTKEPTTPKTDAPTAAPASNSIAGVAAGIAGGLFLLVVGGFYCRQRQRKDSTKWYDNPANTTQLSTTVQMSDVNFSITKTVGATASWEIPFERIQLGKKIGAGGAGQVYQGYYANQKVAIKELFATLMNPSDLEEFKQEAALLASMRHPNIVQFYGVSQTEESFYIVTEYCATSLDKMLKYKGYRVDKKRTLKMCVEIAEAMCFLHERRVVHRDLKPHNLLMGSDEAVRICDFGIAKTVTSFGKNATRAQMTMQIGSPAYMAPELLGGYGDDDKNPAKNKVLTTKKELAFKCDIYSFACVMCALWSGAHIYEHLRDPMQVIIGVRFNNLRPTIPKSCPKEIAALMRLCWQADPSIRPNFPEIANSLRALSGRR